jgi:hypothetical protein
VADLNLRSASRALAVLEERDAVLRTDRRGTPSVMTFQGQLPLAARTAMAAAFDSVVRELQPRSPDVVVRAVVIADTTGPRATFPDGVWYLTPAATDGHSCLVLIFAPAYEVRSLGQADRHPSENRSVARRLLGLCAMYAAFGRAGPDVERWLRQHDYLFAQAVNWQAARPPIDQPLDLVDSTGAVQGSVVQLLALLFRDDAGAFGRTTLRERGCAHHDLDLCRLWYLEPEIRSISSISPLGPSYGIARTGYWDSDWGYWNPDWIESHWFLSDLVRDVGPDRFARFWQSSQPLDSAFATSMGLSLAEWTHHWMRSRLERPRFGPGLPFATVAVGLLLVGLLLSAAGFSAARRQVS